MVVAQLWVVGITEQEHTISPRMRSAGRQTATGERAVTHLPTKTVMTVAVVMRPAAT